MPGPLFNHWLDLRLYDGVRVVPFVSNVLSYMATADLVISQGGTIPCLKSWR
ncbi:UDP-N-acetylglucosamine--N-acetylmuramyl-(pentapeptide) pyrophosphoryl-undecaprenol N-acetylglucosamine transferase [Terriglobus albidus]|uniref:UDP-N-acetylglucosamine--N-acetylmuramyl-(Pentapeptide) pyrophosphoryl-undecaprenol N-acetylglucosamine transferase n=1 Tax=Terriglobus albidus TaxID=1592106 RepID=A0A5B9EKI1_9BACT|nr:UDP-N-acetylglucosamine--N-acetylmuramyl-(pentapeptide) pyrophosphoryl-undecaprenol N-acetylglucosamine transferase [Terriglobus albidus]